MNVAAVAAVIAQLLAVRSDVLLVQRLRDRETVASEDGITGIGDGARVSLIVSGELPPG